MPVEAVLPRRVEIVKWAVREEINEGVKVRRVMEEE